MSGVYCIGEALVDFVPYCGRFVPMAGGAPANVCALVAKLGGRGVFLGKLSRDAYGVFLKHELARVGVDLSYIVYGPQKTAYTTVTLDGGERSFGFYRDNTADLNLQASEIPDDIFSKDDILHFCSVSLVESPAKYAHKKAIKIARNAGALVSFDVNLRPSLWRDEQEMFNVVSEFLRFADIVKVSENELDFLAGGDVNKLFSVSDKAKVIILTKGAQGAEIYFADGGSVAVPAYCACPVDTTGAGDCFIGSVLYKMQADGLQFDKNSWKSYAEFASECCAYSVARHGAIDSYPRLSDIL